ncbi:hypothetical protein D3C75_1036580 [compost metagenome]
MPRLLQHQIALQCLIGIIVKDDDWRTVVHAPRGQLDRCVDHACVRIVRIDRSGVGLLEISKCLQGLLKRPE